MSLFTYPATNFPWGQLHIDEQQSWRSKVAWEGRGIPCRSDGIVIEGDDVVLRIPRDYFELVP